GVWMGYVVSISPIMALGSRLASRLSIGGRHLRGAVRLGPDPSWPVDLRWSARRRRFAHGDAVWCALRNRLARHVPGNPGAAAHHLSALALPRRTMVVARAALLRTTVMKSVLTPRVPH